MKAVKFLQLQRAAPSPLVFFSVHKGSIDAE